MVDTLIVGRTLGVNSLAAVGCTGSMSFLILGFVIGMSSGLSILIAQRFGAKDEKGLRKSVTTGAWISMAVTVVLTSISVPLAYRLLEWMNTPAEIIEEAYQYIVVLFAGIAASMLFNFLSNIIRALGDSRTPLVFLVIACIINIVLDFVLICYVKIGVAGAAWATIIAQLSSAAMCLFYIYRKLPILRLTKDDWRVSWHEVSQHVKVAIPMGFQMSIIAIGALVLQFVLNGLGAVSVAAFSAAQRIDQIATQPMNSFGTTMATYTAQNYGAGKIDRIRTGVFQCGLITVGLSILMGIVNICFGYRLTGIFVGAGEVEVKMLSQTYLHVTGMMYFVLALLFLFRLTIQGLGQCLVPMIAGVMELVMRIFAAIFLTSAFGFVGACWASPLAWIGACIPVAIAYFVTMRKLEKQEASFSEFAQER
jgi:putative MATE family efflux protein